MARNYKAVDFKWTECILCHRRVWNKRSDGIYCDASCRKQASRSYPLGCVPYRLDVLQAMWHRLQEQDVEVVDAMAMIDMALEINAPHWVSETLEEVRLLIHHERERNLKHQLLIANIRLLKMEEWLRLK